MVYVLIVIFNSIIESSKLKIIKESSLTPIVFDNSISMYVKKKNVHICKECKVIYESLNSNVGLSIAYNFIIKKYLKKFDWICILDQDTEISKKFYKKIHEFSSKTDCINYYSIFKYGKNKFGPKIIADSSTYKVIKVNKRQNLDGFLLGINSCSLTNKIVFDKIGYYNENLFLDYIDVDFSLRLKLNNIRSKTIDVNLRQHFFSKEKSNYAKVKNRLSIQKHDAKIFYSSVYLKGSLRKKFMYFRDIMKFVILYCKTNNIFWFLPLLFVKEKKIKYNKSKVFY